MVAVDGADELAPGAFVDASLLAALTWSFRTGAAKTTAVADKPVVDAVGIVVDARTEAPMGIRGAVGFAFCACGLRTGANASAADHPAFCRTWVWRGRESIVQ